MRLLCVSSFLLATLSAALARANVDQITRDMRTFLNSLSNSAVVAPVARTRSSSQASVSSLSVLNRPAILPAVSTAINDHSLVTAIVYPTGIGSVHFDDFSPCGRTVRMTDPKSQQALRERDGRRRVRAVLGRRRH
ncbi:hypothetical protein C8Q74DRAFT_146963 [Fomes fomentarius]|nr:hypothetical protein C8Q74DRAFT_146963 [Fomes fomentarius]